MPILIGSHQKVRRHSKVSDVISSSTFPFLHLTRRQNQIQSVSFYNSQAHRLQLYHRSLRKMSSSQFISTQFDLSWIGLHRLGVLSNRGQIQFFLQILGIVRHVLTFLESRDATELNWSQQVLNRPNSEIIGLKVDCIRSLDLVHGQDDRWCEASPRDFTVAQPNFWWRSTRFCRTTVGHWVLIHEKRNKAYP